MPGTPSSYPQDFFGAGSAAAGAGGADGYNHQLHGVVGSPLGVPAPAVTPTSLGIQLSSAGGIIPSYAADLSPLAAADFDPVYGLLTQPTNNTSDNHLSLSLSCTPEERLNYLQLAASLGLVAAAPPSGQPQMPFGYAAAAAAAPAAMMMPTLDMPAAVDAVSELEALDALSTMIDAHLQSLLLQREMLVLSAALRR